MAATVTLATTTLSATVSATDSIWTVASTSGIVPGIHLFVDRELVKCDRPGGTANTVVVLRGRGASASTAHISGATITLGRGDQFYESDPVGPPPNPVPVSPYINTATGVIWAVAGDVDGSTTAARFWAVAPQRRVTTVADATSITPDTRYCDVTYQANTRSTGTLTINADAGIAGGPPLNNQAWTLKIKSTNVQTFSWNTAYRGGSVPLPTATTGGAKIDYFSFLYDGVNSKWHYTGNSLGF